ncbi:uncharacterized protein LOC129595292 [Paramacrobiotus metropolitanus]|uniref:uncharacterized protein LOC129595292 n=1 Tax=Paramacrobiotus metropolitanus TaxID=2943436 RepID=UPI00244572DE|nr:uncharacterized protein LOC129595292 [Paramacrobiotus metropolitanus]
MRRRTLAAFLLVACGLFLLFDSAGSTFGHYKIYTPYGTGDTIMQTWDAHIGANYNQPERKWIVECFDGEAVIGMGNGDDFTRIWWVWCKFMFPYKPPSQGLYPYYPSCHVRNFTIQFFCYTALQHEKTVNTFITGFYGKQWNFIMSRAPPPPPGDLLNPYKCCKTPPGYYIDYTACYYQPTHDQYWEYYDTPSYFLTFCATGYVMTGLPRKLNPYTNPDSHIDWIQCCRVGFGIKPIQPPPRSDNTTTYAPPTYSQAPRAYAYPPRQRGGPMAHSRFPVDPDSLLGGRALDRELAMNPQLMGTNLYPWSNGEPEGEVPGELDVPYGNTSQRPVPDSAYLSQLKAFFGPTEDSVTAGSAAQDPAQPLVNYDQEAMRHILIPSISGLEFSMGPVCCGWWRRTPVIIVIVALWGISVVVAVNRYYGTYTVYGSGDTIMTTFHAHGGPNHPHRKWHIECMDGEAVVGIGDINDDFQKFVYIWCKFMFPHKPPTNGLYPFYPNCYVQNFTYQYHCYNPKFHDATVHTFVTGFWDNDFQWWTFRDVVDYLQPYKCCKTPAGYYIDYSLCYYFPTHDIYGEYYDNVNQIMVTCATGYVMTGIGKKRDKWNDGPIPNNGMHIAFIQCCRLGYGPVPSFRPQKHTYTYDYYANNDYPGKPSGAYAAQYQGRNLGASGIPRGYVGSDRQPEPERQGRYLGTNVDEDDLYDHHAQSYAEKPYDNQPEQHNGEQARSQEMSPQQPYIRLETSQSASVQGAPLVGHIMASDAAHHEDDDMDTPYSEG